MIVGQCARSGEHGRRACGKERLVVDRLDIHVVENLSCVNEAMWVCKATASPKGVARTFH